MLSITETDLLNDLNGFDSENPDYDVEFIESLSQYYFYPSLDLIHYLIKYIESNQSSSGRVIITSILYKTAMSVPNIDEYSITKILKFEDMFHDKSHLSRHFSCLFWIVMFETGKIPEENIREKLIDKCIEHYLKDDNTVYCRKQMAQLLFKLTRDDVTDSGVSRLIGSIINSNNDVLIDGIADILLQPEIFKKLRESTDHGYKIVIKCRNIQRIEGKTCKLVAELLAADYQSVNSLVNHITQFSCKTTAKDIFFEVSTILIPKLDKTDGLELFTQLSDFTDSQIDYTIPFYELFYQGNQLMKKFVLIASQLKDPKLCSSRNLRYFFGILRKHISNAAEETRPFFDKITERLRKYPNEVLRNEIMNIPGSIEYFREKAEEFLSSKESITFDTGIQIVIAFDDNPSFIFDVSKVKQLVMQKIFQDDDMFLSKDATEFLCIKDPIYLVKNSLDIYNRKTDQQIRILLVKSAIKALQCSNPDSQKDLSTLQNISRLLIKNICNTEDDVHVRLAALELASVIDVDDTDREVLRNSLDEYNFYKVKQEAFYDNLKSKLDDLILTSKMKHNGCDNCIAKECY